MTTLDYKQAGVDIDAGNELVRRIKPITQLTSRPEVIGGLGGFAGLFKIPLKNYNQPVLVSSTDGVGTKLKLALELADHRTIGIDLVAMCVNDIIVIGAEPLYFLDYYATSKLNVDVAEDVIKGIAQGCQQANAALIGGETAEMPGIYQHDDYDLAGFCVGIVDQDKIIDGSKVQVGDILLALGSSGPHSNGYSLIRKIIAQNKLNLTQKFNNNTLGETLLEPTKIYVKSILSLLKSHPIHAMAHITGGGITENLPRVLPNNTCAIINSNSWQWPEIFTYLQQQGPIAKTEMLRTFNCGVGMILCVPQAIAHNAIEILQTCGEQVWQIGHIETMHEQKQQVIFT